MAHSDVSDLRRAIMIYDWQFGRHLIRGGSSRFARRPVEQPTDRHQLRAQHGSWLAAAAAAAPAVFKEPEILIGWPLCLQLGRVN